ncbi:hypothetical protein M413DRAFT_280693 [Hebeloma cylindrosporum]|uniref:Uncharacterized protein n=1 Tax=Hebeloma cylindrosporum TaxID=76867 RepID=A0A0C3C006_HEBCY|nr:hypothetical protein M413DRAFT_280693 [Hebeloma cylindrosporum h7]
MHVNREYIEHYLQNEKFKKYKLGGVRGICCPWYRVYGRVYKELAKCASSTTKKAIVKGTCGY